MPRLPAMKPRDVEKKLLKAGFRFVRQKGSHRIYVKDVHATTIPWHTHDLRKGTLRAIIRQCGMTPEQFLKLH